MFFPTGDAEGVKDYTAGFGLYLDGHRLKLQGSYTARINDPAKGQHTADHLWELQLTVFF